MKAKDLSYNNSNNPEMPKSAKTVVVMSAYGREGKTTLIETVIGRKLEWVDAEMPQTDMLYGNIKRASVEYNNYVVTIVELPQIEYSSNYPVEITDLVVNADLVAELHDSNASLSLTGMNDLLDQEIDGEPISSIIEKKKLFVFTKSDRDYQLMDWWNGLTEEERAERNAWNKIHGNPRFDTYIEAAVNECNICNFYYPYDCDLQNNFFETSTQSMKGIDALRSRCKELLFG